MKKSLRIQAFLLSLIFSQGLTPCHAQTLVTGPVPGPGLIGVAAAVRGAVQLMREGNVGLVVESGEPIYLGDEIRTGPEGQLQILLKDETVFTIGPDSVIVIDEFVYDPKTDEGIITASVVKGAFRFVTGRIAHKKPSNMEVKLPSGTIGVRGTMIAGKSEGMKSFVVLLGPGERSTGGSRLGRMILANEVNGAVRRVEVTRAGFGSIIEGPGLPPLPVFQVSQDQLNDLLGALAGSGEPSGEGGEDEGFGAREGGTGTAGLETFGALDSMGDITNLLDTSGGFINESILSAQDTADARGVSGSVYYASSGTELKYLGASEGSYNFNLFVDFSNKIFGGNDSYVTGQSAPINSNGSFKFLLPETSFSSLMNDTYMYTGLENETGTGTADVTVVFNGDPNTTVPLHVQHIVEISDTQAVAGTGTASAVR